MENIKTAEKIKHLIFRAEVWLDYQQKELNYIKKELQEIKDSLNSHKVKFK